MFREVLLNEQPDLQQGAFLAALVAKGETAEEIAGAWRAISEFDTVQVSDDLPRPLFENSGTGMDGLKTFNVSSAAAIVASACGVTMARHGARAITSFCGTVDILESLGLDVECDIGTVEESIRRAGIGLLNGMSPRVHPGALGRILSQIRFGSTLNIAASLANPCKPTQGVRGVYAERLVGKAADIMTMIGYERGMVVYGRDDRSGLGMDELSVTGESMVCTFSGDERITYTLRPEDAGLRRSRSEEIVPTGDLRQEALRFLQVLGGRGHDGCIDFTCLNAAAILTVAGRCDDIRTGVEMSRDAIDSGRSLAKLKQWVMTQDSTGGQGAERLDRLMDAAGV